MKSKHNMSMITGEIKNRIDSIWDTYKEVEREAIEYEPTEVIMARIGQLENEIAAAFNDLKERLQ